MGERLTLSPEHLVPVLVEAEVGVRAVGLPLDEELRGDGGVGVTVVTVRADAHPSVVVAVLRVEPTVAAHVFLLGVM